jgi:hypothetical protein
MWNAELKKMIDEGRGKMDEGQGVEGRNKLKAQG